MKIGIAGVGMVGSAILDFFHDKEQVIAYDKYKDGFPWSDDLPFVDVLFVCVPTPTNGGTQDLGAVNEFFTKISILNPTAEIVLKSTVIPGTTKKLENYFGLNIIHNPEFLVERRAAEDFRNQVDIIIGMNHSLFPKTMDLFSKHFPYSRLSTMSTNSSELLKYVHNCFLATKVTFWNEMYLAANKCEADFCAIQDALLDFGKFGNTHNQVPGPDGKFGYGGSCFIKDMEAFADWYGDGLISAAISTNQRIRN